MLIAHIATRRLLWKEFRQIWPLVISTAAIWLLLHLQNLFVVSGSMQRNMLSGLLIGLPGIFAVGVGALLVGQEKELRTIGWFCSLPVFWRDVVRSKLAVGLMGLTAMWLVSMALAYPFSLLIGAQGLPADATYAEFATYPLHSLYLMLAGLALAWRTQSSLLSLALLIPVALLPLSASWLVSYVAAQIASSQAAIALDFSIRWVQQPVYLIPCQLIGCLLALYLGQRWGRAALGPAVAKGGSRSIEGFPLKPLGKVYPQKSALIWQFAAQSRMMLGIVVTLLLVGLGLFVSSAYLGTYQGSGLANSQQTLWGGALAFWGGVCFILALSWLAVSIFQSDGAHRRILFLADRGVSPVTVWWTRHAIPLSLFLFSFIICFWVVAAAMQGNAMAGDSANYSDAIQSGLFPTIVLVVVIYCVSQWVGQLFSSPVIASLAGPALSLVALAYVAFCVNTVGTSFWLVGLAVLMPLATTLMLTRRWMDQRFDFQYWMTNAFSLITFLVLPWIPFLIAMATTRSMSRETMAALAAVRHSQQPSMNQPMELMLQLDDEQIPPPWAVLQSTNFEGTLSQNDDATQGGLTQSLKPGEKAAQLTAAQKTQRALELLRLQLDSGQPIRLNPQVIAFFKSELLYARNQSNQESQSATYSDLVNLAIQAVENARQSPFLQDQEQADRLEIVLVYELAHNEGRRLLTPECLVRAASVLGDKPSRDAARRLAVAWYQILGPKYQSIQDLIRGSYTLTKRLVAERQFGRGTELLWKLANSPSQDTTELRRQLAEEFQLPPINFGIGAAQDFCRADNWDTFCFEGRESYRSGIGAQWNAQWEQQAQLLKQQVDARLDSPESESAGKENP